VRGGDNLGQIGRGREKGGRCDAVVDGRMSKY